MKWIRVFTALGALALLGDCDEMESKSRAANQQHELARAEVREKLLPLAIKVLPGIRPVTIDLRVNEAGKVTKCLMNRDELPGCVDLVLEHGQNSAFSFSMEEVAEIKKPDKPLKDAVDVPKAP